MATTIVKGWTKEFCYKKLAESFDFTNANIDDLGVTRLSDGVYELTATHTA